MSKGKHTRVTPTMVAASAANVGAAEKRVTGLNMQLREAEIERVRSELLSDQTLMEKVRQNGVTVTVTGQQMTRKLWDERTKRGFLENAKLLPKRYTIRMAQPAGMPTVRTVMLQHIRYEQYMGAGVGPLEMAPERDWEMFYATADFAALYAEMQHDFTGEHLDDYLSDIMEQWGPHGQMVVGFDLNRLPVARVSKSFNDSTPNSGLAPDPHVWAVPGEPMDRMNMAAIAFQWETDSEGVTAFFFGIRSAGDTFRTTGPGSETTRDAMLAVWMLASPELRMLEATTQKATAGVPPRAKDRKRKLREETITVVTLRRHVRQQVEEVQHAEGSGRSLSHRFVVRGHWRNQAYGTNRALRRKMYILPYVKGPEGAPFVDRERVYQF